MTSANNAGGVHDFEGIVAPHLHAAYRLARWRLRNDHDAEDAVQEASLRAIRYLGTFGGGNARAWFLRIVSNICNDWNGRRGVRQVELFDEEHHSGGQTGADPEAILLRTDARAFVGHAVRRLPHHLRQVLLLREIEGLSYRELAHAMAIPIGTVMSRLSRARRALSGTLAGCAD